MDKILGMIGLAKKAGRLEVGEEPTGAAARAKDARLLLLASDAAENSRRRLRHFAEAGNCLLAELPFTKVQLGDAVGRTQCAMAAVTDIGFAAAIGKKLAAADERYAELAAALAVKEQRAAERRKEQLQHEKNLRSGKRKSVKPEEKPQEKQTGAPRPPRKSPTARKIAHRAAAKADARSRYAASRPVKKGKGSPKKDQR